MIRWEAVGRSKISEEFPTVDEFKDKVEISGILSKTFELDNEGMGDLRMDKILIEDMIDLLGLDDFTLL